MKPLRPNKLVIALTLALAILSGFMVEYTKVNVNYHIEQGAMIPGYFQQSMEWRKEALDARKVDAPFDYYYSHAPMDVLHHLSETQLKALKWVLTLAFTALFFGFNAIIIKEMTGGWQAVRWMLVAYAALFALSFMIYMAGFVFGYQQAFYGVSRKLAGALQSMVPLMFIYPAWYLYSKSKQPQKL